MSDNDIDEESHEEIMKRLYFDPIKGYLSINKFYHRLRDEGYNIPIREVKAFLNNLPAYVDTERPPKPKVFNTIWADAPGDNYQMDTMILNKYKYHGWQYALIVVDVHSRFMGYYPLKTKTAKEYTEAFEHIIETQMGNKWPKNLTLDNEYDTQIFKNLCEEHNIVLWFSEPGQPYKNAIVERLIRTLRQILSRWRAGETEEGVDWPNALMKIRINYNKTYHNTIKQRPIDVWKGREQNKQIIRWIPNKLSIGDYVRVLIRDTKATFSKADDLRWSKDVYQIAGPDGARWKLKAREGGPKPPRGIYMEYELKLVTELPQRTKGGQLQAAQKDNARVAARLRKEDIGDVKEDDGGRPIFTQLVIEEPRRRKPVERYKPYTKK